ncbi:restriction endonuclease subunit S [Clostridium botulinum]|uniref:Restriction endonuclease subunit S n=1 Tax=Clostridium botulinum TaxID=1491 RepID=A0A6M0V3H9_CLOBO|nr:restriction endonuclease subunit S [Clostridium botulinum]MCS6112582.1 restriction endonuclease subunit S [Clostridium botulinum]NFE13091.1 restriction endonuclease subunit S [Clostridium botulinum]NFE61233.1 restriction endonuclease subunit S [Clostridium botulinum]NFF87298.1 restriction endonuclease subunit S [Clostridium botulinum]NFG11341.1 restriction endonuclease subunit S [Clostridium botulinum]
MKELFLNELCNIRIGISKFEECEEKIPHYYLIQLKNIDENGIIIEDFKNVDKNAVQLNHIIRENEVIFKAKSVNNAAAIIKENDKFIATFHFLILSLKSNDVLEPEYLCWYLNQKYAQAYFRKIGAGSVQPIITKQDLGGLKIKVPTIEKQHQIVNIYKSWIKEQQLLKEKIEIKDKYIRKMLEMIVKGNLK